MELVTHDPLGGRDARDSPTHAAAAGQLPLFPELAALVPQAACSGPVGQAKTSLITWPWTSVSRMSRPLNR